MDIDPLPRREIENLPHTERNLADYPALVHRLIQISVDNSREVLIVSH